MSQFAILHHILPEGEHWDFMLEFGAVLHTWQLRDEPIPPLRNAIPARRIGDHRLDYLTYEGPISGNRGYVRRVDGGNFTIISRTEIEIVVDLAGQRLQGRFRLRRDADDWVFEATE